MNKITISKSKLEGSVNIAPSKSLSHRYMIASSLSNEKSIIENVLISEDLIATINILKNFGVSINKINENSFEIFKEEFSVPNNLLDANESGSTLRFLIPYAWIFDKEITFTGKKSLGKRPLTVYEEISKTFNYSLEKTNNNFPIKVSGPLKSGDYIIDGSISSQFITGLLFVLPILKGNSRIIIQEKIASKGYIDLTLQVLKEAGINIEFKDNTFLIKGNQTYLPLTKKVEGDYSQAAFFIVAAIINKSKIIINNLNSDSLQGDKKILEIIDKMGISFEFINDSLEVNGNISKLNETEIDLYDIPDLGPILMVLAASINKTTVFKNIDRLYIKESNRLEAMQKNLEKQGVKFLIVDKTLFLTGVNKFLGNVTFDTFNDHRIAMALAILGTCAENPVVLNDYTVVNKSYPEFFLDLKKIGGILK